MKALMKTKRRSGIALCETALPKIGDNDVLVRVQMAGICGTDLHILKWTPWVRKHITPPVIIGHEFYGHITEVGKNVQHLKVGDRVSAEGHLNCGVCRNCREGKLNLCPSTKGIGIHQNGAFAEYICVPSHNIIPLPDSISNEVAAILDPIGNAVHALLTFDITGEDILITGAGPIGLLSVAIAKHIGAKSIVITDINPYRLQLAQQLGATEAIQVKAHRNTVSIPSRYFSVAFEMSGSKEGLRLSLDALRDSGSLALLGIPKSEIPIDPSQIIFKGLSLQGIYGRKMYETWDKAISLLESGLDLSPIITHQFPMIEHKKAFKTLLSGKAGKVLLHW